MDYRNPALTVPQRVEDLIARMNLREKVAQLCCCTLPHPLDDAALDKLFRYGMGTVSYLNSALSGDQQQDVDTLQRVQSYLREHTRWGIPVLAHSEAIAGAQIPGATTFPQSLGMAATWQPDLARDIGSAVRAQLKSYGIYGAHSPLLDLGRDPRWGRVGETYGEAPLLTARMATAFIQGLQGRQEVMATAKHFLAYGNALGGRNGGQADCSERTLLDEYCLPFEAAIQEGGVMAVMNCYGTLNEEPVVTSHHLLTEILRDKLGFAGPVVSDYGSIERTCNRFGTAVSEMDAAVQALRAGMDVDQPSGTCFSHLVQAVEEGLVEESAVDQAVRRVLTLKFTLGLFENSAPQGDFAALTADPAVQQLSRISAEKSMVLAKNDGILPLSGGCRIALVGPSADAKVVFFGGYSSVGTVNATSLDFNRSEFDQFRRMMLSIYTTQRREELREKGIVWEDAPTPAQEEQILAIVKENFARQDSYKVYHGQEEFMDRFYPGCKTVRQALEEAVGKDHVLYAPGCEIKRPLEGGIEAAVAAARQADVVVAVVGGQESMRSADATCGENKDNANIGLEEPQRALLRALFAVGKPVVTVLVDGRPLALTEEDAHSAAVLYGWLPGEQGGQAIVNVLLGKVNPGGKMPVTVLRHAGQIPLRHDLQPLFESRIAMAEYLDRPSNQPLYPFGHGLSYTSFAYSSLQVTPETPCGGNIQIRFQVKNTGAAAGDEVAQLYWHDCQGTLVRPMRQLGAFVRLTLQPGEERTVQVVLDSHQLAYHGADMQLAIQPGRREVMVGSSAADIRLEGSFTLTGPRLVVERRTFHPQITLF